MKDKPETIMKKAERLADHVQINIQKSNNEYVLIKNNRIKNYVSDMKNLFFIKVWIDGKEGFSYSNHPSFDALRRALKIAKLNNKRDFFYGIPMPSKIKNKSYFDEHVASMDSDNLIGESKRLINAVSKDVSFVEGDVEKSVSELQILNSNGISESYRSTDYASYARTFYKNTNYDDSEYQTGYFNIEKFGNRLRRRTKLFADSKNIPKKCMDYKIILNTECFSQLLNNAFLDGLNAENIINKNSIFINKIGRKLFNNISLYDDGTYPKGVNSCPFDNEGTPCKKTCLIQNGILKDYITDFNTARHLKIKPSGNAIEKGIGYSNVFLKAPYKNVDKAIVIDAIIGAHTSNSLTTDFSVGVERAYVMEGSKKLPVRNFMISGKMIDVLNNIFSMDKRIRQKNGVYSGSVAVDGISVN